MCHNMTAMFVSLVEAAIVQPLPGIMRSLAVLLLAAAAYGQLSNPKCIHSNTMKHTADVVVQQALKDMDSNNDGIVEDMEILNEFVTNFDHDGSLSISKSEFVKQWHATYHDAPDFAAFIFTKFDTNGDGSLGLFDVMGLKGKVDINHDGKITDVEFTIFLENAYNECVQTHQAPV
ncbi:uncharacterized protein LOC124135252 isoform X1 [Haliotis rufescens]|uniref:uncharacterized protein LOC124135252 isoform X1 n=2 Tax=Haliotis rufescens TaxID=6454 RepID=UPI00201FB0D5|nr:uncharacterized protein LOC124135252 isoform X1 [Haliotis rufescens]